MIRPRLPRTVLLATLVLALTLGCSDRKGKVLGNERLLRGEGGLGTTTRTFSPPDRDTYVSTGVANFGQTLLVGVDQAFEGRAFFRRPDRWALPDTNHAGVSILSIAFEVPIDVDAPNNGTGLSVALATTASDYDPAAPWPGPLPSSLTIGTLSDASAAPFRIPLPLSVFPLIEAWAADTLSFPGLTLYPEAGGGLIGLVAGKATISVVYSYDAGGGALDTATVVTAFPNDHYLHPPPSPAPTGADTTLVLGGLFETGVALRFPAVAVPEGATVNEATLLLHVDASPPFFAAGQKAPLRVRQLRGAWPESATDTTLLDIDDVVYATSDSIAVRSAADSVLSVALPPSILRQWTAAGALNEGLIVTIANANRLPAVRVGSRESSRPAELRVSLTTPPPGRF